MRQQPGGRRPRGRSNRKQYVSPKSQTHDSHGPDVRVRGNAAQVYEKYLNLAGDATSSGDRVAAEGYYQFAEHYFRILNDTTDPQRPGQDPQRPGQDQQRHGQDSRHSGHERPRPAREPYPVDAEQPFVEGAGAAGPGNGQSPEPEARPDGAGAGSPGPQVSDAEVSATQAAQPAHAEMPANEPEPPQAEPPEPEPPQAEPVEAEPQPRRRGRPRKTDAAKGSAKVSKPAAEEAEAEPEPEVSSEADGAAT